MSASPKPKLEPVIITKAELEELALWEKRYALASREAADTEKEVRARRLALAQKTLGIESADELKALHPSELDHKLGLRQAGGKWRLLRGAPEFKFVKYSEGQYPAWKQLYIGELGEAAAARIVADTPKVYSYKVEVKL